MANTMEGRLSLDQTGLKLAENLRAFAKKQRLFFNDAKAHRFETEIDEIDLLAWLKDQDNPIKIFWEDRTKSFAVAGIGASHTIIADKDEAYGHVIARLEKFLNPEFPDLNYWGGFSFDPTFAPQGEWKNSGNGRFVIPLIEIRRTGDKTILACNILINKDTRHVIEQACQHLMRLNNPLPSDHDLLPKPQKIVNVPDAALWKAGAAHIINAIQDHQYDKVVLARSVYLHFTGPLNPCSVMRHLRETTSNCFCFIFQFRAGETFLGASPERLYQRHGEHIATEAVAGTRPPMEKNDLLNSTKDLKEQNYVVEMIKESLKPLCTDFHTDENPSLLNWSGGHHLITRFEGRLKKGIGDKELIAELHPTPAVAGTPAKSALKAIRNLETFGRGWYCGPVGYIGSQASEFAVAIRSGLIHDYGLNIYAGAGIIAESSPETEWIETENKLQGFLKIFNTHAD